jgi:hypothetical protein
LFDAGIILLVIKDVIEPIDGVVMINDLAIDDFLCSGGGANIIELVVGVYHGEF